MSGILEQETVMGIVEAKNLTFEYIRRDEEGNVEGITTAVDNVNIDIKAGDFANQHLPSILMPLLCRQREQCMSMEWILKTAAIHFQ